MNKDTYNVTTSVTESWTREYYKISKKLLDQVAEETIKDNSKYLLYSFIEQTKALYLEISKNEEISQISKNIMAVFLIMYHFGVQRIFLLENLNIIKNKQLEDYKEHNEMMKRKLTNVDESMSDRTHIFFKGQGYDAFSLFVNLVKRAKKSIILIDNYVDISTLDILSKKKEGVNVTIYTISRTRLSSQDVAAFNSQYPQLIVRYTDAFHDRFLIIDEVVAYHIGASLKDAGKKCFGISKIDNIDIVSNILQRLIVETEEK